MEAMRFLPAWQIAAPADSPYRLIADPPPSNTYGGTLILIALVGSATWLPYLVGRWLGRRFRAAELVMTTQSGLAAVILALPSYFCLYSAMQRDSLSSLLFWVLGMLWAAGGLSFIAGFREGAHGSGRLVSWLGLGCAIVALLLFPFGASWVPTLLALGLLISPVGDSGTLEPDHVVPGWKRAQAIYSLLTFPPTLLLAAGAQSYGITW
jgi:hypothetical protein